MDVAPAQSNRGTLFVENAVLTELRSYADKQFVMRLTAPKCASAAHAGSFVHIQCHKSMPLRRPLSIMRANKIEGWVEILFKVVGNGLRALGESKTGDTLSLIGPIGKGFEPRPDRPRSLLIGGGVGIPPMIFLAEQLLADDRDWQPLVLMGSEIPFPFELGSSQLETHWLSGECLSTLRLLEDRGVPARLASQTGFDGCYKGYVTQLAKIYLGSLSVNQLDQTEVFACGPTLMLKAVAALAVEFDLPCQISLEEFMACGVGGCAGCAVEVQSATGPSMLRVCVDGPVFDARRIFD